MFMYQFHMSDCQTALKYLLRKSMRYPQSLHILCDHANCFLEWTLICLSFISKGWLDKTLMWCLSLVNVDYQWFSSCWGYVSIVHQFFSDPTFVLRGVFQSNYMNHLHRIYLITIIQYNKNRLDTINIFLNENYFFEMTIFMFSLDRTQTHTIDIPDMSNTLDTRATTGIKYSFNSWNVT
jgi:hypothetical protein